MKKKKILLKEDLIKHFRIKTSGENARSFGNDTSPFSNAKCRLKMRLVMLCK